MLSDYTVASGEFNIFPRETSGWDTNGWSILTPQEDSRLIYVSSSVGDDANGEIYAPRDIADVQNPGLIKPFKTIASAIEHAREGYPDWILLQKGDEWEVPARIELRMGRSIQERSVITSYGTSTKRPTISNSEGKEMLRVWSEHSYIAVIGLSFYADQRDPDSENFSGWGNVKELNGILIYGPEGTRMGSILIEDNEFNFLSKALSVIGKGDHVDIVIRRNLVRNSYHEFGHSQGMSAHRTSALLEENIFDHNGWYTQQIEPEGREKSQGQGTIYNHNTYFSESIDTIFRENIFLRPSSIHNKWTANPLEHGVDTIMSRNLIMDNNLYVGGEIGISAGGNDDFDTGARWKNVQITDNVMMAIGRDRPTNRTLGWYIDTVDWDGGSVCGNYLLNNDNELVQNLNAIKINGHSNDVTVTKNLIYGLKMSELSTKNGAITLDNDPKSNITITENNIQLAGSNMFPVIVDDIYEELFQSNTYFTGSEADAWFRVEGVNYSYDDWLVLVGESGSSSERQTFSAPERTFESYLTTIGLDPNVDAFIAAFSAIPPGTWDDRFSVVQINSYIRGGYGNITCN